jgi:hypothetical protein
MRATTTNAKPSPKKSRGTDVSAQHGKPKEDSPEASKRPADTERIAAFVRKRKTKPAPPQFSVSQPKGGPVSLAPKAEETTSAVAMMEAFGTFSTDFANQAMSHLVNAVTGGGVRPVDETELNAAVAAVAGIGPKDEAEAMLAVQMVAIHVATMVTLRRLKGAENIPQLEANGNLANKLARTFASQMEALKKYRSKGEQKVTVEHVTVNAGGQAIVGAVASGGRESLRNNPMQKPLPMHLSPRCRAHSKRSGLSCRSPAVKGSAVCRMHGARGGAPTNNRNARKHGHYSREALAERTALRALARFVGAKSRVD